MTMIDTLRRSMVVLIAVFMVLGSPFYSWAQEVGRMTYAEGRVDIFKPGSEMPVPARTDEVISLGDVIRTKSHSKAEITFKDQSILRLAENSRVNVKDYQLTEDDKRQTATIELERGKIRTIIEKMAGADFKINTPNAHGTIKGSDVFAFYQAGNSGMLVSSGSLQVVNPNIQMPPLMIPPGSSVLVPLDEAPKGPRPFFELEKTFYEKDTNPPAVVSHQDITRIEGLVTKISGSVRMTREGSQEAQLIEVNQVVGMGSTLETGDDGMIEIKFDNGNSINLKSNTRITLTKLLIDPGTRGYENLFESDLGKVKATIENIKGGSSFQIKTPHAISGVRGTLLYLIITPFLTKVLFEGGPGFITSLITGITKDVPMGQSASADDQGAVSDPVPVSGEERLEFSEGWEPGSGVEGYSRPDGVPGEYFYDLGTSVETVGETGGETASAAEGTSADTGTGDQTENLTLEIPITVALTDLADSNGSTTGDSSSPETTPPLPEAPPEPPEGGGEPGFLLGSLAAGFGGYESELNQFEFGVGSINGSLESEDLLFTTNKAFDLNGTAILPPPQDESPLWLWQGTIEGEYDNGARYLGLAEGVRVVDVMAGLLNAIYIRPDGNGGFLAGTLSTTDLRGSFDPSIGMFEADGHLNISFDLPTSYSPADLLNGDAIGEGENDVLQGNISGDHSIQGTINVIAAQIEDQDWGLWLGYSAGTFGSVPTGPWMTDLGGIAVQDDIFQEENFILGSLTGDALQNNEFAAVIDGVYLSFENYGTFHGDLLGTYEEEGQRWQALSTGSYTDAADLSSSGDFFFGISQFGQDSSDDGLHGLLGLTDSLWDDQTAHFVSIGELQKNDSQPFIWHANEGVLINFINPGRGAFYSQTHSSINPLFTTFPDADGQAGAFVGISGGVGHDNILAGTAYGFYTDPQGNRGIFHGDLAGTYADSPVSAYQLEGTFMLDPAQAGGFNPDALIPFVEWNELLGSTDSGNFQAGGNIQEDSLTGLIYHLDDLDVGVFGFSIQGTFENPTSDNWQLPELTGLTRTPFDGEATNDEVVGSFLGGITGTQWSDNILEGELHALWIVLRENGRLQGRSLIGEVIGNYVDLEEEAVWQAASTGEWVEVDDLLDLAGPADDLAALGTPEVPISEIYTSLLNGGGTFEAGGTLTLQNFFIDFFIMDPAAASGIWVANLIGDFTGPTGDAFSINANGNLIDSATSNVIGTVNATLTGSEWAASQWQADVNGSTDTGISFDGAAAGTFDVPSGTFSGAGTGVWDVQ